MAMIYSLFKSPSFSLFYSTQRSFALYRKPKTFKLTKYPCIPDWMQGTNNDQFDYKLRSKEELKQEHKYYPPNFPIQIKYKNYTAGDTRVEDNLDTRERVAKIYVDMRDMSLSPQQRERFIFLLGPRYQNSDKVKLVCKQYNTYHENYVRVMETLRELYWEAKRAPSTNITMKRNPYRREFFIKKFLGKTKEERIESLKAQKAREEDVKIKAEERDIDMQKEQEQKNQTLRERRRANAAKRLKLGFDDREKEEVDDPILDELEYKSKEYQQQIAEQKERKPVKMVTEINAISKDEVERLKLKDEEKFTTV